MADDYISDKELFKRMKAENDWRRKHDDNVKDMFDELDKLMNELDNIGKKPRVEMPKSNDDYEWDKNDNDRSYFLVTILICLSMLALTAYLVGII